VDWSAYVAAAIGVIALLLLRIVFVRTAQERVQRLDVEQSLLHATHLSQLTAALSRARTPADVTRSAVIEFLHAFRADAGAVVRLPDDGGDALVDQSIGFPDGQLPASALTQANDAIRRHELLTTDSAAAVPLSSGGRAFGALVLSFDEPRKFAGEEHTVLLSGARHTAQAFARAQAYESAERARAESEDFRVRADAELRERHRAEDALRESEGKYRALAARMTRLYELSAALSEAITLDSVAKVIVRQGKTVVGASAGSVAVLVNEGREFETLYAEEYTRLVVEAWHRFGAEPGLCATAATETRSPVFVGSLSEWQKQYPRSGALAADSGFESAAALPLLAEGTVIGVLSFHFTAPVNFTPDYVALLRSVSQHCTQALDRARLYETAQRARADAESANRAKDDFLSTLSHELRTPLNAMLGWASMLRNGTLEPDRKVRALDAIFSNASRQAQLIEDLLDVSRIIARGTSLDREQFRLPGCLRGAVEAVMPAAESKGVELRLEPIPDVTLWADRRRLDQVFLNLISNAVKFTPAGGRITIEAAIRGESVDVWVADTGAGVDPAFLPHIFERFRQGDSTSSRRIGGLGLGLFIARHLVEAHGGSIAATSDGIGRGTTFIVTLPTVGLPAVHEPPDRPHDTSSDADGPRLTGIHILLVDDEADALEVMSSALEMCGAEVKSVASAREALESLTHGHFDVLLSDLAMPEADGYDLIRTIRNLPAVDVAHIPAAAVTAFAGDEDRRRALEAGYQAHLAKPVAPGVLAKTVAHLIEPR